MGNLDYTFKCVSFFQKPRGIIVFTSFLPRKRSHRAFPFSKDDVQQYHVVVVVVVVVVVLAAAVAVIVAERRERYTSSEKKNVE